MQILLDFIPLVLFIGAYAYGGIYVAITVLMIVLPMIPLGQWLFKKKVSRIHVASAALVIVMGGVTLALRNPIFLMWKPTVFYVVLAGTLLGFLLIGQKSAVERGLGHMAEMTRNQWRVLDVAWIVFLLVLAGVNLYVAYNYDESTWVYFKLWGLFGATFLFIVAQSVWIAMHTTDTEDPTDNEQKESL